MVEGLLALFYLFFDAFEAVNRLTLKAPLAKVN